MLGKSERQEFRKKIYKRYTIRAGVIGGVVDIPLSYINSAIQGEPMPYLTYHHQGFMVHNSYLAGHKFLIWGRPGAHVIGSTGHLQHGASKVVEKHEIGHMQQFADHDGMMDSGKFQSREYEDDMREGTINYRATPFHMYDVYGPQRLKMIGLFNLYYGGFKDGYSSFLAFRAVIKPESFKREENMGYQFEYFMYVSGDNSSEN